MESVKKLYPSKKRYLLISLLFFIFVISAGYLVLEQTITDMQIWSTFLFAIVMFFYFTINLIPNSAYLFLNKQGFTVKNLFHSKSYKWEDIEYFYASEKQVGWKFNGTSFARSVIKEDALPDNYGMKAKELANLLNNWKDTYTNTKNFK